MQILINGQEINAEIQPLINETLDETLDVFSFTLLVNDNPMPYAPMQDVTVIMDNFDFLYFVIVSDSVELASFDPIKYKHNITCTQNTRKLSKHIVRNSVFTQPSQRIKYCSNRSTLALGRGTPVPLVSGPFIPKPSSPNYTNFIDKLGVEPKEKVFKSWISIGLKPAISPAGDGHHASWVNGVKTFNQLKSQIDLTGTSHIEYDDEIDLVYNLYGNTIRETINIDNVFGTNLFNTEIEYPRIAELLNQGATNLYLDWSQAIWDSESRIGIIHGEFDPTHERSIAFMPIQLNIKVETYYYTVYDVLDLLIKRQQQTYNGHSKAPLFSLPSDTTDDLYKLLKGTIAPDFTFTQNTMYECVAEVFRLFDAIFTMDRDGVLGIEYLNERNKEEIEPDLVGVNLAIGEDRFNNKLIAYYQDGRTKETFPAENMFAPLRSQNFGVPEMSDHNFMTPHPIHDIEKATFTWDEIQVTNGYGASALEGMTGNVVTITGNYPIDITRYIPEESIWTILDTGTTIPIADPRVVKQNNSIYFKKGDNVIQITSSYKNSWGVEYFTFNNLISCALWVSFGMFGAVLENQTIDDVIKIKAKSVQPQEALKLFQYFHMRITYNTMIDGRTAMESDSYKYDGDEMIDQYSGAIDLNKMGINMLGLSYKLGEPSLNISHSICNWDDRIKKGQILVFDGQEWIANSCSYTFLAKRSIGERELFTGQISFVKNFNSLGMRTRLLKEKRLSNISQELTIMSEDNIVEYVYYSTTPITQPTGYDSNDENTAYNKNNIITGVVKSFNSLNNLSSARLKIACLTAQNGNSLYLPLIIYGAGNSICFEMQYNHPINAGNKTQWISNNTATWFGNNKWYTSATKYTTNNGFLDSTTIYLAGNNTDDNFDQDFPMINLLNFQTNFGIIQNYQVYKQPNEIFALNYQIAFISVQKNIDFFYPKFMNESYFVNGEVIRDLYFVNFYDQKCSIFDTKISGTYGLHLITGITKNGYNITITTSDTITSGRSWGICDSRGELLFASNNCTTGEQWSSKTIYLLPSRKRNKDIG